MSSATTLIGMPSRAMLAPTASLLPMWVTTRISAPRGSPPVSQPARDLGVLRRGELLGLLVDWGFRTTAYLSASSGPGRRFRGAGDPPAKTGARVLPIRIDRAADDTFDIAFDEPMSVPPNDPAALQRVTQGIADELAVAIAAAPHQWYSFKPMWPASEIEAADLERRALAMQAGQPDPGPGRGLPRDEADQVGIDG